MRMFSFVFLIALVAILGLLAFENNRLTTVTAWNWNWEVPIPVIVATVYVLGMLTGGMLLSAVRRSWYRTVEMNRVG
ncbi:MAG: hypothetical protein K8U57_03445 [Planctomycetes bacterium]|nr:hypothetical protein [Planctomycetota bacterium]